MKKYYALVFVYNTYRGIAYVGKFKTRMAALKHLMKEKRQAGEMLNLIDGEELRTVGHGALEVLSVLNTRCRK
jgi:hypothetical protein